MSVWALVPIRSFASAKRRLASALTPAQRAQLSESMAAMVLTVLRQHPGLAGVAVVSTDPAVRRWAQARATRVIADPDEGLNAALNQAAFECQQRGVTTLLVIPADVPALRAADLSALLAATTEVVVVPARRDGGTNALRLTPPTRIPFCFGPHSAQGHVTAAYQLGARVIELDLPSLAVDIDVADDLVALPDALRQGLCAEVPT